MEYASLVHAPKVLNLQVNGVGKHYSAYATVGVLPPIVKTGSDK